MLSFNERSAFAESLPQVFNRAGCFRSKASLFQVLNSDLLRNQKYSFTLNEIFCLFSISFITVSYTFLSVPSTWLESFYFGWHFWRSFLCAHQVVRISWLGSWLPGYTWMHLRPQRYNDAWTAQDVRPQPCTNDHLDSFVARLNLIYNQCRACPL